MALSISSPPRFTFLSPSFLHSRWPATFTCAAAVTERKGRRRGRQPREDDPSYSSAVKKGLRFTFMEELMGRARSRDAAGVADVIYDMVAAGLSPGPRSFHGFARQFQRVGRVLPTPSEKHPKIYGMKLQATNEVSAKSKFWHFLRKLKKVKRRNSQFLAIEEREVQNVVMFWQEKIKQGFDILFSCKILIMMLIISASVSVSKAPTWALTEDHRLFLEAWKTIDRAYIDKTFNGQSWFRYREYALRTEPMNNREETYMAIKKMLSLLDDPFTRFLEPEKFKSLRSGTQGALTGVGLSIGYPTVHNASSKGLVVISAIPGGPANKSGVKPGDVILTINDRSTEDMDIYEAADLLQGTEGSSILLDIRSGSEIKHMFLRREKITLNPVKSRLCEVSDQGNDSSRVGYIKLTSFNQNSSGALRDAIMSLRGSGVQSFVLDLRDNSGGLFTEGIETAKIWLDKGVIVYICDHRGIRDIYEADGSNAIAASEPLVVLVNRGTASASEILAGALKDNRRAILYGEPTFGKGKIQSVFELSDGAGLVVTVARYETPAHIDIDKVGIAPDHRLPPSFPINEDSFCSCLKDPASACGLNSAALFSR